MVSCGGEVTDRSYSKIQVPVVEGERIFEQNLRMVIKFAGPARVLVRDEQMPTASMIESIPATTTSSWKVDSPFDHGG
jgi:hypothetical protein